MESPLSDKIKKIFAGINKILSPEMKIQLYETINYSDHIEKKIRDKIQQKDNNYICKNCTSDPCYSTNRRDSIIRHIKNKLSYYKYRCSFCDEKSNDPHTLIIHYASTHGIPSNWLESN